MVKFFIGLIMLISSMAANAETIVVLGDSISAGYGMNADQDWVVLLEKKLQQEHKNYRVINESISGDTSSGGVARIAAILKKYQPKILILELGANDGLRGLPPQQMQNNLTSIIQQCLQLKTQVLLLSMRIPPNYGKRYTDMFYNVYVSLAKEFSLPLVPFILQDVALVKELMQADGLHPNAKAQPLIVDKVWQHLATLIK